MKFYPTGKQTQLIDKYTQEVIGLPGLVLMEKAAGALADEIEKSITGSSSGDKLQDFDKVKDKIIAVVEGGNNGGDAVAAAWMLKERGYNTYIYEINGISRQTDSYKTEIRKAKDRGVVFVDSTTEQTGEDWGSDYRIIIDGIFGVGLSRDVRGVQSKTIDAINRAIDMGSFVVGTDIPSGISSDTGHILGNAVRCDMTVTFEYIKYGMLLNEGRTYCGDIKCRSIGLYVPESIADMSELLNKENAGMLEAPDDIKQSQSSVESIYINYEYEEAEIRKLIPSRKKDSNKGTYGKVLIIAGSNDVYGAVYMAAESAYRVGAGLVKVVTDIRNRDVLCDKLPEAMILTYDTEKAGNKLKKKCFDKTFIEEYREAIKWADIVLCGPGIGTAEISKKLLSLLAEYIAEGQKLILDADALNIISMDGASGWLKDFTSKTGVGNVIITPHMMEMLRIIKSRYDKKTFDFMLSGLGYDSEMMFLKDFRKSQSYNLSYTEGIITVLKDARTVVTYTNQKSDEPGMSGYMRQCPVYVNTTGNSGMSKGGSGDVLAGMIAGLLAQNKEGRIAVADIVCAAVYLHGRAGDIARDRVGERSMMARDIIDAISVSLENKSGGERYELQTC